MKGGGVRDVRPRGVQTPGKTAAGIARGGPACGRAGTAWFKLRRGVASASASWLGLEAPRCGQCYTAGQAAKGGHGRSSEAYAMPTRRDILMTTLMTGFTLAVTRAEAEAIHTDSAGLHAGPIALPTPDGSAARLCRFPGIGRTISGGAGDRGDFRRPRIHQGRLPPPGQARLSRDWRRSCTRASATCRK